MHKIPDPSERAAAHILYRFYIDAGAREHLATYYMLRKDLRIVQSAYAAQGGNIIQYGESYRIIFDDPDMEQHFSKPIAQDIADKFVAMVSFRKHRDQSTGYAMVRVLPKRDRKGVTA
jgi:hypothetical protein